MIRVYGLGAVHRSIYERSLFANPFGAKFASYKFRNFLNIASSSCVIKLSSVLCPLYMHKRRAFNILTTANLGKLLAGRKRHNKIWIF